MNTISNVNVFDYLIEDPKRPITVKEAAFFLNLSPSTIYKKISKAEIPSYRQGRQLYFLREELRSWLLVHPIHKQRNVFEDSNEPGF
jgi:excisionase family DNA binding protein